jgi:hypothetical protein
MQDLILQLGDSKHLAREKALVEFSSALKPEEDLSAVLETLSGMLQQSSWEMQYGALKGYTELVARGFADVKELALQKADELFSHPEFRVRVAYGELLGALAMQHGVEVYTAVKPKLFSKIWASFEAGITAPDELTAELVKSGGLGWQSLETSMRTLQAVMKGLRTSFEPEADSEFWRCMEQSVNHPNRFVREIGHFTIGEIYVAFSTDGLSSVAQTAIDLTAKGLGDNWSQVRLAASTAARQFLEKMGPRAEEYDSILIPRLCLNRYYVAEGVRIYNQVTWKAYVGTEGRLKVATHAGKTVEYFISQCLSDNHAVREAACLCIAELATKVAVVAAEQIQPHIPALISALLDCFKDASWTVRDASCLACGEFVQVMQAEAAGSLPELKRLWLAHLSDNINSVRAHSAYSIIKAAKAYQGRPEAFLGEILAYLDANLFKALEQPEYDVVHAHEDKQENEVMYSCGSLAPKLRRGVGCMDHGFSRPCQPWEYTDGCIYLIKELIEAGFEEADAYVPRLADLLRLDGFKNASHLKENILTKLLAIARLQGKLKFKQNLEVFLDPIFRELKSKVHLGSNYNVSCVAEELVTGIVGLVGRSIFVARVEQFNPSYVASIPG